MEDFREGFPFWFGFVFLFFFLMQRKHFNYKTCSVFPSNSSEQQPEAASTTLTWKHSSKQSQGREAQVPAGTMAQPSPCALQGPPAATWAHQQDLRSTSAVPALVNHTAVCWGVEMKSLLLATSLFSDN